jgi:probable HAF family extracellular repeat protein
MPGRSPDNAALGDTFLVVSSDAPTNPEIRSIYYVRVSSLGVVLDATPRVAIGNFSLLPRVTNLGARWLVVAETHPNHDRPTSAIRGNFVDAGGNAATSFSVSDGGFDKRPDAASSNEQALVTWSDRDIYGRRILADGTLLDTATGIVISNAPGDQFSPAVAWDGAQFLCAWLDHRNKLYPAQPEGDIYGARVSAAGAVLDPDGFVIANSPLAEETPEVAGANGTGLFEYAAFYDRAPYSSFRIALRRFPFDANYSLSAQPTARTTTPGGSAAYTITLNPASGFNGAVNFSVYGLPTGATATFSPASINGTGQTTLTVTTDARTLEDIYRLTVVGSSGAQQSTVVLALTVARDPMAVRYNVVDLGNLGNTRTVEARAVNEANQVAGLSSFQANSTAVHAFRWTNGVLQDLGTLGGPGSRAYGINGAGAVVGYADKTSSGQVYRPFIYANGVMQELPLLPGTGTDANGGVFAINDAGQMAGFSELEQRGGPHAVVYNNGTPTDLGTFGGLWSIARAINETGQVAGDATNSSGYVHAFLATNNVKRDLGNLLNIANVDSYGYGVNDAAQVVGGSQYRADFLVFHAFLYVDGRMLDLGTFGGTESFAYDINNAGQVVGYAALSGSNAHRAFLYEGGALINLNTLIPGDSGWTLTEAYAINEQGAVVGKGTLGGVNHAFLLTPISQPAAKPPVVSITSPANGATYTGRQNLAVTAGAASSGGQIARVDFYADGNLLGTDAVAPYEIIWGSVQPGTYALTAVATDDSGRATTSRVVQITVNAAPATISTWLLQSILPPGTALNGATMISPTEGWAVGDNGTILHFKDGLLEQQFSGTTEQLNAVAFLDANRGWAVGNVTLYTTNGGFTWQEGDTTTGSGLGTLYTLDVVDADQVWAIGNGGFVRTMDGGHIWSPVTNLPAPNLTGVHFLNAQLGWLGGSNGTLYRTTDGGAHWTLVPTNTTTHLGGVQFVSPTEGWASGNNYVIHTTDGGSTWTQQTLPAGTWLYDLKFADALHGWGVGAQENIIRTVDGGQTWTTVSGGVGSSGVYPYWSVDFADATHGVILRSDALLLTADAGTTLVPQRNGSASVVNRLFALDAQHAWAAARNAEILRTTNGGASWQPVALFANANGADVSDVDFVDESNGWATVKAGPPGFVYHSTDGGATWQNASAPATGALSGVDAVDAQTIVAVGTMKDAANASHGLVLRSTNGGTSWTTATPSATATTFNAVQFVGQTGWLVGDKGVILKSTDGGASWTPQPSTLAATVALTDVSFADANNGWAAAGQILLHTTNGGQTWSVQPYGSGFPVYAVSAVSATHAWLAGYNGLVARTTNGGTTWTPETLLTQTSFYACAFYEAETGWLGGEDSYTFNTPGRIYKRIGGVPNPLPNAPPTVALAPVAGGGGAAQAGHGSLSVANINATAAVVNYVAPADVPLSAIAADSDGQVRKVDFYNGATLIGTDNSAPYQLTWTGVPAGTYTVTAIATDNAGASAVSNVITVNVAEPRYQLTGQVTDPRGNPLGGVTVTLGGARSEVVQTDASGSYRFVNLTPAASYTVTPARTGFLFTPSSLSVNNISADTTANFVGGTQVANAGDLIISEFRFSGAQGALDEFVELYNTTAQAITVQSVDGSSGWQVAALAEGDNVIVDAITIPNGTVIPAHGHYLATNSGQDAGGLGYSLGALAAGDQSYRFDLPDASGIALFTTTNANNFTAATRLDAVGFTSADALYREGAGLQPAAGTPSTVQYSWVRKQTSGTPQDTNDNVADFQLVAMSGGLVNGVQSILGAPGPESTTSPNQRNATVKPSLIEPQQASTAPPNRVRDTTAHVCTGGSAPSNCALGTLTIRRRFTNKTGAMVTSLRFRIVDVTTLGTPNPAGTSQADLRGLDSVDVTVTTSAGNVLVKGTSIQTPPVQAQGGGLNSAYVVNLAGGALAPNASVNVQFVLGVQAGGSFRFLVNVEAGNQPPAGAQKVETLRISK